MADYRLTSLSLAAAVLALSAAHAATTVTLRPDNTAGSSPTNGDAFVTTGSSSVPADPNNLSGNNYGAAGSLAVSAALANGSFASLLRFDTSSAKSTFDSAYGIGGWSIDSIALQLTTTSAVNAIFNTGHAGTFDVSWIPSDSWVEGTGTPQLLSTTGVKWNDFAGLISGAEAAGVFNVTNIGDGVSASYTLNPSSSLLNDLFGGTQASLAMTADPSDSSVALQFNSRNFGTAARRPALIITASATPEPERSLFLLLGAASTFIRRRRPARTLY